MQRYFGNEFVAFFLKRGNASQELVEQLCNQLPEHSPYRVWERWDSPRRQLTLLNLGRGAEPPPLSPAQRLRRSIWPAALEANRLHQEHDRAWLMAGYITSTVRTFTRSLRCENGRLRCEDAGGIAAFCLARCAAGEDEQLFLWSTRPGLRSIAWAETAELVVAGTRPRLVHELARDFGRHSLDSSYLRVSLTGWSLGDRTPYEGTTLVAADKLLAVRGGEPLLQPHPTPDFVRQPQTLSRQVTQYRAALREAAAPLGALPGFEFRLSGGKDSRLVAALLCERRFTPAIVACHGRSEDQEARVAAQVATALGWSVRFDIPELAYRGSLLDTVRYNLGLADGFFATEPRHVAFPAHGISGDGGPGIVLGHIELQKGGWARDMNEKAAGLIELCRQRATPLRDCVVPPLTQAARSEVDAFVAGLRVEQAAEYGYWINYRFRVCRWLIPHYLMYSSQLLPVYPLVDEKVARLVHTAPLEQLVSERLMFETTCILAPSLAHLPLHKDQYRFEKDSPRRIAAIPTPVAMTASQHKAARLTHDQALREACAHIRTGAIACDLRELSSERAWKVIEDPTPTRIAEAGMLERRLIGYLWTCYQATVLFTEGLTMAV